MNKVADRFWKAIVVFFIFVVVSTLQNSASASNTFDAFKRVRFAPCANDTFAPRREVLLHEAQVFPHFSAGKVHVGTVACVATPPSEASVILNRAQRVATLQPGEFCVIEGVGYACTHGSPQFTHRIAVECERPTVYPANSEKGLLYFGSFRSKQTEQKVIHLELPLAAIQRAQNPGESDRLKSDAIAMINESCRRLDSRPYGQNVHQQYSLKRVIGLPKAITL